MVPASLSAAVLRTRVGDLQQAPPISEVRIAATAPATISEDCDPSTPPAVVDGSVTFERQGSLGADLDVAYLVGSGGAPPETATFLAGEETVVVRVSSEDGSLTLIDGDEYDLGRPSTTELMVIQSTPACVGDLASPVVTVGAVALVAVVAAVAGVLLWRRRHRRQARVEAP